MDQGWLLCLEMWPHIQTTVCILVMTTIVALPLTSEVTLASDFTSLSLSLLFCKVGLRAPNSQGCSAQCLTHSALVSGGHQLLLLQGRIIIGIIIAIFNSARYGFERFKNKSFNPHSKHMRMVLLLPPFSR